MMSVETSSNLRSIGSAESFGELHIQELLPIHPELQKKIHELIHELGSKTALLLGFKAFHLQKVGQELKEKVHPLRFLFELVFHPKSKENLEKVYQKKDHLIDGRIWSDFVFNLGENFKHHAHTMDTYLKSFADSLELEIEQLKRHHMNQDWESLVKYVAQFQ